MRYIVNDVVYDDYEEAKAVEEKLKLQQSRKKVIEDCKSNLSTFVFMLEDTKEFICVGVYSKVHTPCARRRMASIVARRVLGDEYILTDKNDLVARYKVFNNDDLAPIFVDAILNSDYAMPSNCYLVVSGDNGVIHSDDTPKINVPIFRTREDYAVEDLLRAFFRAE